jgi:hypothetical protein
VTALTFVLFPPREEIDNGGGGGDGGGEDDTVVDAADGKPAKTTPALALPALYHVPLDVRYTVGLDPIFVEFTKAQVEAQKEPGPDMLLGVHPVASVKGAAEYQM